MQTQRPKDKAETGAALLLHHALNELRQTCGRRDYINAQWTRKTGTKPPNRRYRITRRNGHIIYYCWDAVGAYPPRGMSMNMPIGRFLREFESV